MSSPNPAALPTALKWAALRNPALIATAAYAVTALIGVSYSAIYFAGFGLNVFRFWDASDLLLAAFREPVVWALAIGVALYTGAVFWLNRAAERRLTAVTPSSRLHWLLVRDWTPVLSRRGFGSPVGSRRQWRTTEIVGVGLIAFMFVTANVAIGRGNAVRDAVGPNAKVQQVLLELAPDGRRLGGFGAADRVYLIGSADNYLFVYDGVAQELRAIPREAVYGVRFSVGY